MLLADPEKKYSALEDLLADVSGEWLTYNQAKELGGFVRKGEKGRRVIFFKPWERKTGNLDADGQEETETIPVIRSFTVFRVSQCDGITPKYHANEVAIFLMQTHQRSLQRLIALWP